MTYLPLILNKTIQDRGFPGNPVVKNPPANEGDTGLTPGLGRSQATEQLNHAP